MHLSYQDIRSRIPEPPTWFDSNGVPRYGEFEPHLATIYGREVALLEIACQGCEARFMVALVGGTPTLAEEISTGEVHYGDPPSTGCCPAGDTMNCVDLRVVEYWRLESLRWKRVPEYQRELPRQP